jgi:glutathione S-transferase
MSLLLYAHPFASYCQKVLIALYENSTPFEWRLLDRDDPTAWQELEALWPPKRFPVLVDGDRTLIEASIIVEHLDLHHPGPLRLVPEDARAALEVRFMDRVFDNYVSTPRSGSPTRKWRGGDGRWARISASPTAPPRRRFSTPTGRTRSPSASPPCAPTARGCWRDHRSRAWSTRRGPIGRSFPSARPIAIDQPSTITSKPP